MILHKPIEKKDFSDCTHKDYGEFMVKLVADLHREILAYDAEWHADLEAELLVDGSAQKDLWGFNYYPDKDMLEYNSLINIRPTENKSSDILDSEICALVERVFRLWVA
ncbi:MAG: DUF5674 family protein [Oscillospiraceae bacterium]|nr:DUF5674 family protein [Oscillospiraceae bacterium]